MGLQAVYERFLASPNPLNLTNDAVLQYVTTLTSFTQQGGIIKHLESQQSNVVKKKSEKIISTVEGLTSVAVIVETSLQFLSSGGAYLPGLDNFIIDKIATLPITHFVHFDQNDKITQIRLSWDQGDLLKQVDIIGTRGKNWPVYGGKDQIKMITASTNTANEVNPAPTLSPRGRSRGNGVERSASPSKKYIKDPHASLNLFEQKEDERQPTTPNAVAPRESHKPAAREMSDLFAAGHEDYEPTRPGSPPKKTAKESVTAPKGAAHKKFQPSRVFDDENDPPPKEAKIYKTNPARYNHFDIGDVDENDHFQHRVPGAKKEDMPIRPKGGSREQRSQWDFGDFITPEKVKQKSHPKGDQGVVHFSYDDAENRRDGAADAVVARHEPMKGRKDNDHHFDMQDSGTPTFQPVIHKSRKDAESHFSLKDEPTPAPRRIISRTKAASKLYDDPVFGGDMDERPLASLSNNARKDQVSSWDFDNKSPANGKAGRPGTGQQRKGLESQWGVGDDDTAPKQQQKAGARGRREQEKGFWDF